MLRPDRSRLSRNRRGCKNTTRHSRGSCSTRRYVVVAVIGGIELYRRYGPVPLGHSARKQFGERVACARRPAFGSARTIRWGAAHGAQRATCSAKSRPGRERRRRPACQRFRRRASRPNRARRAPAPRRSRPSTPRRRRSNRSLRPLRARHAPVGRLGSSGEQSQLRARGEPPDEFDDMRERDAEPFPLLRYLDGDAFV